MVILADQVIAASDVARLGDAVMKLSARDARLSSPGRTRDGAGFLIYGDDAMRVALKRQEVVGRPDRPARRGRDAA